MSCVFESDWSSYFLSVFSSTVFLYLSISNSLVDNFFVNFSSSSCFSFNSFSNFCLFSFKLSFLASFCSNSSFNSCILSFCSDISFSNLWLFSSLFVILVFATFISEFKTSISFWLSNPKFDIFSISSVISSILDFNSSFRILTLSSFPSSSLHWVCIISISFIISSKLSLYFAILYTNNPISIFFNSSLKFKYFLALSDWTCNGPKLPSISAKMSLILSKFNFVCSNFFSDSCFLVLYFTIPAASSKICLLSSDLLLKISSIFPCPIIEYPSFPIPVSINNSRTSFKRQGTLLIKYPVSPLL